MSATATSTLMTADELLRMPDDGFRYELIDGELKQIWPAGFEHGAKGMNLAIPLGQHVKKHNLGRMAMAETGYKVSTNPDTVMAPDISFVRRERIPITEVKGFFPGAPDLAIEVVSPGDTMNEVDEKVEKWLQAGSSAVWIVNPRRKNVTVYTADNRAQILSEGELLQGGDVVPNFSLRVAEIFE